jgi:3-oxoacyl-(acyl-carrier-protein) synthase
MQEIKIKLWRHTEEKDWSAEVYGKLHKHIATKTVDELVEYVVVAAQQALLDPEGPPGNIAKPGDLPVRKRPRSTVAKAGISGIHIVALLS